MGYPATDEEVLEVPERGGERHREASAGFGYREEVADCAENLEDLELGGRTFVGRDGEDASGAL